jgi:hypothetical protein
MKQMIFGQPTQEKIVLNENGDATFLTINPIKYMLPFLDPVERNSAEYLGKINPLPPVIFSEVL